MNQSISAITLTGNKQAKQLAREQVAHTYDAGARTAVFADQIKLLDAIPAGALDTKIKQGQNLTYDEAFVGMCYVLAATNLQLRSVLEPHLAKAYGLDQMSADRLLAIGTAFLQAMAVKESLSGITPQEIAGCVAAASMDTVTQIGFDSVIETCGMGGDRGYYKMAGKKTINVSTLCAIVLSSMGLPAVKHGSYGNTTKIGSTEAIEMLGLNLNYNSADEALKFFSEKGFCYLDAHWAKTIHDLSHLIMMETINHIIGPMTPPFAHTTAITKLVGVNEKVYPADIVRAYTELHKQGVYNMAGVIAVCGLSERFESPSTSLAKNHGMLDELSPFTSIVAVSYGPDFLGESILHLNDICEIDAESIFIENTQELIQLANTAAITGEDQNLAKYLAANAALAHFAYHRLDDPRAIVNRKLNLTYLKESFAACLETITSGQAAKMLESLTV